MKNSWFQNIPFWDVMSTLFELCCSFLRATLHCTLLVLIDCSVQSEFLTWSFVNYSRLWNKRSPWNNRSPPLKNFHIMILILFYTNLGIAIIFDFFCLRNFSKINKRNPTFIPESRVCVFLYFTIQDVAENFITVMTLLQAELGACSIGSPVGLLSLMWCST